MPKAAVQKSRLHRDVSCPFCGLLCDDLTIRASGRQLRLEKNGCDRAVHYFQQPLARVEPKINGKATTVSAAVKKAASILRQAQTPLFAGLGTDVDGMRATMELADASGAIVDHMHGDGLFRNVLVLQDLGWITTTMAEIKNRADLIIFAGTDATQYPRFFERVIWNKHAQFNPRTERRKIIYIGDGLNTRPGRSPVGKYPTVIPCQQGQIGELISAVHALIAGETLDLDEVAGIPIKILQRLAEQMQNAEYGVIVWAPSELNIPHAELTIQSLCEVVKYLTRVTRFAGFSLAGNDGAATANNVCTWQSGYPLRVNFNKGRPDYDAHRYASQKVLKNKAVDALLWISSFTSEKRPPKVRIPTIVLAKPDLKINFRPEVMIPVATPGVDHVGQLFRTDGVIALPMKQLRPANYLSVAAILKQIITGVK